MPIANYQAVSGNGTGVNGQIETRAMAGANLQSSGGLKRNVGSRHPLPDRDLQPGEPLGRKTFNGLIEKLGHAGVVPFGGHGDRFGKENWNRTQGGIGRRATQGAGEKKGKDGERGEQEKRLSRHGKLFRI